MFFGAFFVYHGFMNESVELNESLRADYLILGFADEGRRAEDGLFGLLDTGF